MPACRVEPEELAFINRISNYKVLALRVSNALFDSLEGNCPLNFAW